MKLAIFGIGYIGSVCCAGFSDVCKELILIDVDKAKLKSIKNKNFEFPELEVAQKINAANNIRTDVDANEILSCGAALLCLPTEPLPNGELDLSVVRRVLSELINIGFQGDIIIRSTLDMNFTVNLDLDEMPNLYIVPEFLREGSALSDFLDVECLVVGASDPDRRSEFVERYLGKFSKQLVQTNIDTAIFTKLLNNSWHALKVAFSNDWARIAESLESIFEADVFAAFTADSKLNMSAAYHRPGGPYGGPCLPKDISAFSRLVPPDTPSLFPQVELLNDFHIAQLAKNCSGYLEQRGVSKFSFNTLEFKKGTGDSRHSPLINMVRQLEEVHGKEYVELDSPEQKLVFDGRRILDDGLVAEALESRSVAE